MLTSCKKIHMHAGRSRSFAGAAVEIFTVAVNDRCDCDHVTFVSPMDSRSNGPYGKLSGDPSQRRSMRTPPYLLHIPNVVCRPAAGIVGCAIDQHVERCPAHAVPDRWP